MTVLTDAAAIAKVFEGAHALLPQPCQLVIFGGPGDLSWRKLLPAVYNLDVDGVLPSHFTVVAFGMPAEGPTEADPDNTFVTAPRAPLSASRASPSMRAAGRISRAACSSSKAASTTCARTSRYRLPSWLDASSRIANAIPFSPRASPPLKCSRRVF